MRIQRYAIFVAGIAVAAGSFVPPARANAVPSPAAVLARPALPHHGTPAVPAPRS